ncbi:hypothetical protein NMY22_g4403 [Coprinellus aureogranulatus]|nr:hypothetical protein NMY22_g4403 [Coprinellus aureogranulatus]
MASDEATQAQLDAHIHRLELELSEIKRRRNALSPVSRLPPEIFCKIFASSIPDIDYRDHEGRTRSHAMKISHVSHSWRVTAIACPELWGDLHVGVETKVEILTLALERAGHSSISINMCGHKRNSDPPVPSEEVISALSGVIRKRQARCQHFSLYMREDSFQSLFGEMTGSFDNLLSLKLDIVGIDDRYADLSAFLRHPFPQLRRLEVERPRFPCSILKQSLHLTHADIHKLILSSTAIADLLSWLKRATALRTFRIGLMEMPYPQPALEVPSAIGDNSIHLPNLEVFNVNTYTGLSNTVLEHLLSSISIPITCSLSITALNGERLAVLFGRAYGHLAPVALDLTPNEGRTRAYDRSTSASTAEKADVYNRSMPWIHISRYGGGECLIKAWEWGWSFACLRVLHVGDLHNAEQGTAKRFWSFLAESAVALEVLRITSFCVSRIGVDEFLDSLRGSQAMGNIDSQQVPWPALRELHSPLPSDYKYEFRRANRNESTPQLHTHFEYAFALVDALKEREMSTTGSGSGGKQLDVLRFTQYFEEPLDPEVTRILRGGAAKILGAVRPSQSRNQQA